MKRTLFVMLALSVGLLFAACSGDKTEPTAAAATDQPTPMSAARFPTTDELDPTNAQAVIFHQIELLRAGNVDELKLWFTARLAAELTPDVLTAAVAEAKNMPTKEQMAQTVEVRDEGGKRVAVVTMEGGRTLTTMVLTDGRYLSDTLWFK
jgi:hypothetical protein